MKYCNIEAGGVRLGSFPIGIVGLAITTGKPDAAASKVERRPNDPRYGLPILRFRQRDGERRHPPDADALHRSRRKETVDLWCTAQATAWHEDRTHHRADGSTVIEARSVAAEAMLPQ